MKYKAAQKLTHVSRQQAIDDFLGELADAIAPLYNHLIQVNLAFNDFTVFSKKFTENCNVSLVFPHVFVFLTCSYIGPPVAPIALVQLPVAEFVDM